MKNLTGNKILSISIGIFIIVMAISIFMCCGSIIFTDSRNDIIKPLESETIKNTSSNIKATSDPKKDTQEAKNKETISPIKKSTPEPTKNVKKTYNLSAGNYEIGKDIKAGTYDFIIVSGISGNVISGWDINLIMGTDKSFAIQNYKNAKLIKGKELKINGNIKIKLIEK